MEPENQNSKTHTEANAMKNHYLFLRLNLSYIFTKTFWD